MKMERVIGSADHVPPADQMRLIREAVMHYRAHLGIATPPAQEEQAASSQTEEEARG